MTPSQLYDGILKAMNDKEAIDLIGKAKEEWERISYGQGWINGVNSIKKSKLNAPEP